MAGQQERGTQILHPDGNEYAVLPDMPDLVVAARWVGTHALEVLAKKNGEIVGQATYEISTDGTTLTARVRGTDTSGTRFEHFVAFEPQAKVTAN